MTNQFDSKGGDQNVGQGDHAIGKHENITQEVRGDGCIFSGTGNVTVNGIPPALFAEYAGKLAVTDSALASFFKILEEKQVPLSDLDSKLREIAFHYKALLRRVEQIQEEHMQPLKLHCVRRDQGAWSIDPHIEWLGKVWRAITAGDYSKAEVLLEKVGNYYFYFEASEVYDLQAYLQCVQLHYAKAAEYWQHSASISRRPAYLSKANYALQRIAHWSEALPLWIESLMIYHRIGDKAGEAVMSWNIGRTYEDQGDLAKAEQSMSRAVQLAEEIGHPDLEECRKALKRVRAKLKGR